VLQTSKLTAKYRVTVPTGVRRLLQLKAGDRIAFEIEGNEVRLRRAKPLDDAYTQAIRGTFGEWSSEQDDQAFKTL
jgi:antitoxin PrlF